MNAITTTFDFVAFNAHAHRLTAHADGYAALSLTAEQAAAWANRGFLPGEAAPWITAGFTPDRAAHWADNFVCPAEAKNREWFINTLRAAAPIGTNGTTTVSGQTVHVQVAAIDVRRGYRVSNRQWGGLVDTWVPFTDFTPEGK